MMFITYTTIHQYLCTQLERALHEKKTSYDKTREQYDSFKANTDKQAQELQKTSELLQTLTTGITAEEGHENGYMEQLQGMKHYICLINTKTIMQLPKMLPWKHLRQRNKQSSRLPI